MKNKKEFFGVLISVLASVFLVFLAVYATTVGSDITVTDDLVVTDALQVDGTTAAVAYSRFGTGTTGHSLDDANDLLISDDLEVDGTAYFDGTVSLSDSGTLYATDILGGRDTGLYVRIGDEALTSHSLAADDDLLVNGQLEVDGNAWFDSNASVSGNFVVGGTASISDSILVGAGATITSGTASITGNCTIGSIYLRTGVASMGLAFNVCDDTNSWTSLASASLGW